MAECLESCLFCYRHHVFFTAVAERLWTSISSINKGVIQHFCSFLSVLHRLRCRSHDVISPA